MGYSEKLEKYVEQMEKLVEITSLIRSPAERDKMSEEELAEAVVLVDVIGKLATEAKSNVQAALNVVLATGVVLELGDMGVTVEKRVSAPKKSWNHEALISVVAEAILEQERDPESGAIDAPYGILMGRMFEYASVGYWRIKSLRDLGVSVEEFCEVGDSKTSYSIGKTTQSTVKDDINDDDFF